MPCSAKASYKKLPGTLELNGTHIQWTQDGKKAPAVRVPHASFFSLFCSKDGSPQVRLKLALVNDDTGHNFTFISTPQSMALAERETFKTELTNIIAKNRSAPQQTPQPAAPPSHIKLPTNSGPITAASSTPGTPASFAPAASRAASVSSDGRTPIIPGTDAASDFRLRKRVLLANTELASLHRELVMTGQITEAEFWEGREHLLLAESSSTSQKRGRPGTLVDPRPQAIEGGEVKIIITPQLVTDIFEEFPVVQKAYAEVVPKKLNETEFWRRYFQSKLFHAHRASIRSSATQHVVKEDPIFDKYLEKDDDEIEPRRARDEIHDLYINLGATNEDHEETGNTKDFTMQAGRQRGALPLIRKFNEHSERLLNSTLGDGPAKKKRKTDDDDEYRRIELEDLNDFEASSGIVLEMQDRQRYFEGRGSGANGNADGDDPAKAVDIRHVFAEARKSTVDWSSRFSQLKVEKKAGDAAFQTMTQNVATRLKSKGQKNDLPPTLFASMRTCQTAANEFLRQFWTSMYPPIALPGLSNGALTTAADQQNRAAKAAKMAGYLGKTHEKVASLVEIAKREGADVSRVEVAMKPMLDAVDHATTFWSARQAKGTKAR
ncbi:hypothetical protein CONPUDRAFT_163808 [Coniophora puteana RWD-64-598 SS2]|uniref:BSD domain-containing protein n=1 Tax=Coniophora puteana (strain RWD-64-598) TaxID=741705 RepID=A0A5M3MUL7_CONPW|nr:uncharacterized protein CONPUDRAFT_163808 [Coniophora puteana RWD-64-598 SS2]EIW82730.1 hypothetical protein CONPUDRAFT_163808 [Coniophora puteana RWD-64-598 SS2]